MLPHGGNGGEILDESVNLSRVRRGMVLNNGQHNFPTLLSNLRRAGLKCPLPIRGEEIGCGYVAYLATVYKIPHLNENS